MLRLCRSSLCLEVIDFEGCVASSGLHVQYLDSAISAGVDAVPLAKCFDNRQYLTEQAQRQFQALLGMFINVYSGAHTNPCPPDSMLLSLCMASCSCEDHCQLFPSQNCLCATAFLQSN